MRKILYILLFLPVLSQAQVKIHGNAVEKYMGAYQKMMVSSTDDSTMLFDPTNANIVIKNFNGSAAGASVGSTTRLGMFSNSSFNGIMMGSFGSSPANGFSFYAWGGNNVTRTATPSSAQFLIMGFNGYDGSSSASGGLLQFIAPAAWTNTTGGHLMNFEIRATSLSDNTARPRLFYNSELEALYSNSRGTGRFALGLFEITKPYAKFHVDGTNVLDTIAYYRALTGNRSPFAIYSVGSTVVASIDSAGNHIVPKLFLTNPTSASSPVNVAVIEGNEVRPYPISSLPGGGGGEANTASNLGGGLSNYDSKSGVDLRFNSFSSSDFDLASNLFTIKSSLKSNWNTAYGWGDHAAAGYESASNKSTSTSLGTSNTLYPSQNAVKAYVDAAIAALSAVYAPVSHTHAQGDITDLTTDLAGKQASDADLTAIAALSPTNDDIIQRKAGAWANRTMAQLKTDLALNNVENTALSTWAGSANITTTGTISSGTWNGGIIAGQYGGTGVANTGKTITVSGNTTIGSSTHTVAFATSANTSVTLPTSGTLATIAGSETFTNKTLTSPVISSISNIGTLTLPTVTSTIVSYRESNDASSATPTPIGDARQNKYYLTALATAPTFAAPSGTPANGNELLIRIKDNGTARALAWNAIYRGGTSIALPTTTTISKTMYVQFVYNSADSRWDLVGLTDGL